MDMLARQDTPKLLRPFRMKSEAARTLVAGTCGGCASILVCHPLDTIRTRLQTAAPGEYAGAWDCAVASVRAEGVAALYKGLLVPLLAQGAYKAIMFGVYGACRRRVTESTGRSELEPSEIFACGAFAGGANALVLTPVELVRNRLQVARSAGLTVAGALADAAKAAGGSRLRGAYRGVCATLLRDVPGVGAYYAAFEIARRAAVARRGPGAVLSLPELAAAGAAGGAAFWTVALPFDCVKSRLQVGQGTSTWATLAATVRAGGLPALYVGYGSALVRGVPGAAVVFAVYGSVEARLREDS